MPCAPQLTPEAILSEFEVDSDWLKENYADLDAVKPLDPALLTTVLMAWTQHRQEEDDAVALCLAAIKGDLPHVTQLLDGGVPWDVEDRRGCTAGEYALHRGHPAVWDLLVARGAASLVEKPRPKREDWNLAYLEQPLAYNAENLLDASGNPVMMPWEGQIMEAHARQLHGAVLNVGFGIGLIDGLLQQQQAGQLPRRIHHIIEAHPDVQKQIVSKGWREKEGVELHFGRWQDCMSQIEAGSLDAVFFDTHDEGVEDMLQWAAEAKRVLKPTGLLSFWNAYQAHNIYLHSVHCRAVTVSLKKLGFETRWHRMPVEMPEGTWEAWKGVQNWYLNAYHLPMCTFSNQDLRQIDEEGLKPEGEQVGVEAADMSAVMRRGIEECAAAALAAPPG
jgi:type IV protein arginine methyltransferase